MTPSQQAKSKGLDNLKEVSSITGVSDQTLINWHKSRPRLFKVVLAGALVIKHYGGENAP